MILCFSGGADSWIAYHYLRKPKTIYFDLGHRYAAHEVSVVRNLLPDTIIETSLNLARWEEKDANIPMRNLFLVAYAALYDPGVALVVQRGEMDIPDRSPGFFIKASEFMSFLSGKTVCVSPVFSAMTKTQMVNWYLLNGLPKQELLATRSCYSGNDLPCGACSACFRRWVSFINNGLSEEYQDDILKYEKIPDYLRRIENGEIEKARACETLSALRLGGYAPKTQYKCFA